MKHPLTWRMSGFPSIATSHSQLQFSVNGNPIIDVTGIRVIGFSFSGMSSVIRFHLFNIASRLCDAAMATSSTAVPADWQYHYLLHINLSSKPKSSTLKLVSKVWHASWIITCFLSYIYIFFFNCSQIDKNTPTINFLDNPDIYAILKILIDSTVH